MKTFLGVVLVLVLLAACAAGGWFCWTLEQENRTLRAAVAAAEVERARLAAEHGQCAAQVAQTVAAQEAQARAHDEATNALARVQAEARRLRDDVVRAEAARDEVRRRAEADVAKLQGELEKARAVAARVEQTERARRRAEDPLADVGSLKDLLDLTDKAPRRAE